MELQELPGERQVVIHYVYLVFCLAFVVWLKYSLTLKNILGMKPYTKLSKW